MKKQKNILPALFIICVLIISAAGCKLPDMNPAQIHIGCMKGPTAIGMVQLITSSDEGYSINDYYPTIAGTADEISSSLINGTLDIAAVPCNLASILYNKTDGEIVTAAINTLGVLYIVENGNEVQAVSDLKGKTIYSTGQGTTPEYTLRYLLESAGLNPDTDVTITFKSEAPEVVAMLSQNPDAVAMLPQPYVTAATESNPDWRIALDVTAEWEALNDSTVVTGVIVARRDFIEKNENAFQDFLAEYKASATYANEYTSQTAQLLERYDIFPSAIAVKAIPYCNVTCITGEEMQEKILAYLEILYEQNPDAIGGKLPEEGMFYLEAEN